MVVVTFLGGKLLNMASVTSYNHEDPDCVGIDLIDTRIVITSHVSFWRLISDLFMKFAIVHNHSLRPPGLYIYSYFGNAMQCWPLLPFTITARAR